MSFFDSVCQVEGTEDAACSFLTTVGRVYVFRDCDVAPTTIRSVCLQFPSTTGSPVIRPLGFGMS
jgi:hypothetical protein